MLQLLLSEKLDILERCNELSIVPTLTSQNEKDLSPANMTMDTRWVLVLAVLVTLWRGECQVPRVHSCRRSPRLIRRAEGSEASSGTSCQASSTRAWTR